MKSGIHLVTTNLIDLKCRPVGECQFLRDPLQKSWCRYEILSISKLSFKLAFIFVGCFSAALVNELFSPAILAHGQLWQWGIRLGPFRMQPCPIALCNGFQRRKPFVNRRRRRDDWQVAYFWVMVYGGFYGVFAMARVAH